MKISIGIVDDHPVVVEGLRFLLDSTPEFEVIHRAYSGEMFLSIPEKDWPDVIVLDINLPDISGINLCKIIKEIRSDIEVIGISNYNEPGIIVDMINAGASGYLLKNADKDEIVLAIKTIHDGKKYFSKQVYELLAEAKINDNAIPNLTPREKEIVKLVAAGLTTSQIAEKLFISELTAETHRKNILRKFNVNNTASMIKKATELKML